MPIRRVVLPPRSALRDRLLPLALAAAIGALAIGCGQGARVVSVVDANTIKYQSARWGSEPVTARLFGIYLPTPESPVPLENSLAARAHAEVKRLIEGEAVDVEVIGRARNENRVLPNGAVLAQPVSEEVVLFRNGVNVNRVLVEQGFAEALPPFGIGGVPPKQEQMLIEWAALAKDARANARGFWRDRCAHAPTRFPGSDSPEIAVMRALDEMMQMQGQAGWQYSSLAPARKRWAQQGASPLVAGWIAESLWNERQGMAAPTLTEYLTPLVGKTPAIPTSKWADIQSWPPESCEGAFMHHPSNARHVATMRSLAR